MHHSSLPIEAVVDGKLLAVFEAPWCLCFPIHKGLKLSQPVHVCCEQNAHVDVARFPLAACAAPDAKSLAWQHSPEQPSLVGVEYS